MGAAAFCPSAPRKLCGMALRPVRGTILLLLSNEGPGGCIFILEEASRKTRDDHVLYYEIELKI
jgi:hypothetical protein